MSIRPSAAAPEAPATQMRDGSRSLVDRHTTVDGTMETPHDLRVEGRVSGVLRCDGVLYVASGAEVDADVAATDAIIEGTITGSVVCSGRLEIRPSGVIRASVRTRRLVIHEGAVLEGRLDMEHETLVDQPSGAAATLEAPSGETAPAAEPPSTYSYLRSFSSPGSGPAEDTDLPGRESAADDEREDDEEDDQR